MELLARSLLSSNHYVAVFRWLTAATVTIVTPCVILVVLPFLSLFAVWALIGHDTCICCTKVAPSIAWTICERAFYKAWSRDFCYVCHGKACEFRVEFPLLRDTSRYPHLLRGGRRERIGPFQFAAKRSLLSIADPVSLITRAIKVVRWCPGAWACYSLSLTQRKLAAARHAERSWRATAMLCDRSRTHLVSERMLSSQHAVAAIII